MKHNSRLTWLKQPSVSPEMILRKVVDHLSVMTPSLETDYLRSELLKKFVSEQTLPPKIRREAAIDKWRWVETINSATEVRLLTTPDDYQIMSRVSMRRFLTVVRKIIVSIIGTVPPVDALFGGFSGGASTSRNRTRSHPALKFAGKAHITQAALPWWDLVLSEAPLLEHSNRALRAPIVVSGNVMFTVPKSTEIDRVACKEPDLNMYMQKGVGNFFRRRLMRRAGVNLNDQSINRRLAYEASISGDVATLDLSSASDSITCELVYQLLPPLWAGLLMDLRSPTTRIGNELHVNTMISSMGNGFTFELESLLFFGLMKAVATLRGNRGVLSVYGDDLICPVDIVTELSYVLTYFGFTLNEEKSHWSGTFRESCGGHYDGGRDITPFYIRRPLDNQRDLITLANNLRRWAGQDMYAILDPEVEDLWNFVVSCIDRRLVGGSVPDDSGRVYHPTLRTKYRLTDRKKRIRCDSGALLHWHDLRDRSNEPADTSLIELSRDIQRICLGRTEPPHSGSLFPGEVSSSRYYPLGF